MCKKLAVAISLLIPSFIFGARTLQHDESVQCTPQDTAAVEPHTEQQTKVQERVYQVWCGGIF